MQKINGNNLIQMHLNAAALVTMHANELNELNVFPVPDGDTGTNMSMTMNSLISAFIGVKEANISKVADTAAATLLRGARGNSGVILALLFRGFAKRLKGVYEADSVIIAEAMEEAVKAAYAAVVKPAEGTILTVSYVSTEYAMQNCAEITDIIELFEKMLEKANEALALTPTQNPILAKAGVVDAGAKGYCFLLEGMLRALKGEVIVSDENEIIKEIRLGESEAEIEFAYCTEFIIEKNEEEFNAVEFRKFLIEHGNSIVLVDDDEIVKVHVHSNNPGLILEEAVLFGGLIKIKIENMKEQNAQITAAKRAVIPESVEPDKKYGFVAVAAGEGVCDVFNDLGVDVIVEGGQTMNPSTEDILSAINKTPAEIVFVLPNNKNIIMAAEQTVSLSDKKVCVINTVSLPQGISAMLAFNEGDEANTNIEAMEAGAKNILTGQITYAARNSSFDGHEILAGDYIALFEGKLCDVCNDFEKTAKALAEKLDLPNKEYITVFCGQDTTEENNEIMENIIKETAKKEIDLNILNGGQPVYYYIISAE